VNIFWFLILIYAAVQFLYFIWFAATHPISTIYNHGDTKIEGEVYNVRIKTFGWAGAAVFFGVKRNPLLRLLFGPWNKCRDCHYEICLYFPSNPTPNVIKHHLDQAIKSFSDYKTAWGKGMES